MTKNVKSLVQQTENIFSAYVEQERKKLESENRDTTQFYDSFVRAARLVDHDITDEKIDSIYFANYSVSKYSNTFGHWWEDRTKAEEVKGIMANLLANLPEDYTSKSDILHNAGYEFGKDWWGHKRTSWNAEHLHAFDLLYQAGALERVTVKTCGKNFIHLYRAA